MQTIRFHDYGDPGDVLRLEVAEVPIPGPGHIRVRVQACGLNPADWALCRGLFAGALPRGIGLDVAGTVDAIGEGVAGVSLGDRVVGAAAYADYPCAGASDDAVLDHWAPAPAGLPPNWPPTMPTPNFACCWATSPTTARPQPMPCCAMRWRRCTCRCISCSATMTTAPT